jgi:lysophospholipase L1-like esterase
MSRLRVIGRMVVQVLVVAIVLEALLRLFGPVFPGRYQTGLLWEPDPALGYRHVPGTKLWIRNPEFTTHVEINRHGHRDVERSYEKPPGVYRILLLGDSMVEAVQVPLEQAFSSQLEGLLAAQAPALRVEVINTGVSAYGTDQELLYLQQEGLRYQPDLVILMFTVANDVRNNSRRLDAGSAAGPKPYFDLDGQDPPQLVGPSPQPAVQTGGVRSRLRSLAGQSALATAFKTGVLDNISLQAAARPEMPRDYFVYARTPPPEWEEAWTISELLIERVRSVTEASGAAYLLVVANSLIQVYPAAWDEGVQRYRLQPAEWDSELPNRRLHQMAARYGWPILDLLSVFRLAAAGSPPLYYRGDAHWTAEGHRLAADAVARYLVDHGLVSTR